MTYLTQMAGPAFHNFVYTSANGNNGSAFAELASNTPLYNWMLGFAMLIGRFAFLIPLLAIGG